MTANGKQKLKVTRYGVDHVYFDGIKYKTSDRPPLPGCGYVPIRSFTEIPCGQCLDCRLSYSRQWAERCMLELQDHKQSWFVTLTYDNDHVPTSMYGSADTGECLESLTLRKSDLQKFWKRLRKAGYNIRYYACGEYGSQFHRPHYHAICFGLELDDLVPVSKTELGYPLYQSETMDKLWPFGLVRLGEVNYETCAYTARYVMKKAKNDGTKFCETFNVEPEFVSMSLKPGIGRNYFDTHPNIYEYDRIHISTAKGGKSFRPPRYYDKLFDLSDPDTMALVKEKRKNVAQFVNDTKLSGTDLSYLEYLSVEEANVESRLKSLKRGDCLA